MIHHNLISELVSRRDCQIKMFFRSRFFKRVAVFLLQSRDASRKSVYTKIRYLFIGRFMSVIVSIRIMEKNVSDKTVLKSVEKNIIIKTNRFVVA